jgi:predicted RNA-binding Zn-ribbon protein involved in translation (DUF1610 family)
MNRENNRKRELHFVCPECGSEGPLCANYSSWREVEQIYTDGWYDGPVYESDIVTFECSECGYVLRDEKGNKVYEEELAEWVAKNCPQEHDENTENESAKTVLLEPVPTRRFLGFVCDHCGGRELAWRSRWGHGRTALIREVLIMEDNLHPIVLGEYPTEPPEEKPQPEEAPREWTCGQCGRPVFDNHGACPTGLSRIVGYLSDKRYEQESSGDKVDDISVPRAETSSRVPDVDEFDSPLEVPDLRCPQCGGQEFIEQQEAVVFTPVQIVNGELAWLHHERCIADYWDGHETHYHCPKCGFEAPEPFDEWVEQGCPADWQDDS